MVPVESFEDEDADENDEIFENEAGTDRSQSSDMFGDDE